MMTGPKTFIIPSSRIIDVKTKLSHMNHLKIDPRIRFNGANKQDFCMLLYFVRMRVRTYVIVEFFSRKPPIQS